MTKVVLGSLLAGEGRLDVEGIDSVVQVVSCDQRFRGRGVVTERGVVSVLMTGINAKVEMSREDGHRSGLKDQAIKLTITLRSSGGLKPFGRRHFRLVGRELDELAALDDRKGEPELLVPFDEVLLAIELGDVSEELAKVVVGHLGKGGQQGRETSKVRGCLVKSKGLLEGD
jgi:hypothetical protein